MVLQLVACGDFGSHNGCCSAIGYRRGETDGSGGGGGNMCSGDNNGIVAVVAEALGTIVLIVCSLNLHMTFHCLSMDVNCNNLPRYMYRDVCTGL